MLVTRRPVLACGLVALAICAVGCRPGVPGRTARVVEQVRVLEGFSTPEGVCVDPATGYGYVSNIVCKYKVKETVNAKDGQAFISRLAPGGTIDRLRWVEST